MAYNTTFLNTGNDVLSITAGLNTEAGGFLAIMFLVVAFFIFLAVFGWRFEFKRVLVADFFFVTVISLMLFGTELIGLIPVILCIVGLFLSLLYHLFVGGE